MKPVTTTTQFIPVTSSHLGQFNTASGRIIDLRNPSEDQIDIEDIAAALSRICRFGGHGNSFYSVAQHSVLVMHLVRRSSQLQGIELEALLHDAAEAYLGDVISPLKHLLGASYKTLETNFETVLAQKFDLRMHSPIKDAVKAADIEALKLEHEALIMGNPGPLVAAMSDFDLTSDLRWAWHPEWAAQAFLVHFRASYDTRNWLID